MKNFSFFSLYLFFLSLFIEQNGTYIYTKGIFSLLKGKTHTHTLFKLDSEAWMYDRHEMMIDSYCTNRSLEKVMDCPREKEKIFIGRNRFVNKQTCRIPAAVNGENCE